MNILQNMLEIMSSKLTAEEKIKTFLESDVFRDKFVNK